MQKLNGPREHKIFKQMNKEEREKIIEECEYRGWLKRRYVNKLLAAKKRAKFKALPGESVDSAINRLFKKWEKNKHVNNDSKRLQPTSS